MADPHAELTCQEVVELVTDYLEGALPEADQARVEQHLSGCDGCDRYVEQIRITVASVGRIREENLSAETRGRLVAAFRDWKQS